MHDNFNPYDYIEIVRGMRQPDFDPAANCNDSSQVQSANIWVWILVVSLFFGGAVIPNLVVGLTSFCPRRGALSFAATCFNIFIMITFMLYAWPDVYNWSNGDTWFGVYNIASVLGFGLLSWFTLYCLFPGDCLLDVVNIWRAIPSYWNPKRTFYDINAVEIQLESEREANKKNMQIRNKEIEELLRKRDSDDRVISTLKHDNKNFERAATNTKLRAQDAIDDCHGYYKHEINNQVQTIRKYRSEVKTKDDEITKLRQQLVKANDRSKVPSPPSNPRWEIEKAELEARAKEELANIRRQNEQLLYQNAKNTEMILQYNNMVEIIVLASEKAPTGNDTLYKMAAVIIAQLLRMNGWDLDLLNCNVGVLDELVAWVDHQIQGVQSPFNHLNGFRKRGTHVLSHLRYAKQQETVYIPSASGTAVMPWQNSVFDVQPSSHATIFHAVPQPLLNTTGFTPTFGVRSGLTTTNFAGGPGHVTAPESTFQNNGAASNQQPVQQPDTTAAEDSLSTNVGPESNGQATTTAPDEKINGWTAFTKKRSFDKIEEDTSSGAQSRTTNPILSSKAAEKQPVRDNGSAGSVLDGTASSSNQTSNLFGTSNLPGLNLGNGSSNTGPSTVSLGTPGIVPATTAAPELTQAQKNAQKLAKIRENSGASNLIADKHRKKTSRK